ncbi:protein smoothened isoform X1 [Metopolophium dirhodum]|uniref:protein smoothened isoform X1 n=1 Tax=Metopolophium dirhodum TaxID=44670 RepID=UPI00298F4CC2|nr:protein smoothened isoform X1 [Metopolophium dirhodum]
MKRDRARSAATVVLQLLLLFSTPQVLLGLSKSKSKLQYCERPHSRCLDMNHSLSCLGVKLPYTSTSTDLVPDAETPEEAQERLHDWQGLKKVPKCWAAIQPLLCALYIPNCENSSLHLPPQEMCKLIENHCQILKIENSWPAEFNCENETIYPAKLCKNDLRELKFNSTAGRCESPLVQTYRPEAYHYPNFEGCDLQCYDPLFSMDEHRQIHNLIAWTATIAGLCNIFAILTFMIEWQSLNRYPNIVILYINVCFLFICFGWLSQFWSGTRDDIVCRKNGARKTSEPSDEDLSCVINFVFSYYFLIAAFIWFVIFTYSLHTTFQSFGKIQEKVDKKGGYFHLLAWSIPLVFCVVVMVLGEIDGDSVTGTCFVGVNNKIYSIIFVLIPILISVLIGLFYLVRVLFGLLALKKESTQVISKQAKSKIHSAAIKVIMFMILIVVFVSSMFMCYIYEYNNDHLWKDSLRKYIVCKLGIIPDTDIGNCRIEFKPSVSKKQLYILVLFGNAVLMSFWVWTNQIGNAWCECLIRWLKKLRGHEQKNQDSSKYNKHKLIASAFAKRHQLNSNDFTVTFSKEDPFGLVFGLNSNLTDNISSTWAAALPKFIRRRGALTGEEHLSVSSSCLQSDSEISYSMCRVSVESRSHSLDSTISVKAFEMTRKVRRFSKHVKKKHKRSNKLLCKLPSSQKGSVTSQDINRQLTLTFPEFQNVYSQPDTELQLNTIPNLERRTASAGIDESLKDQMKTLKTLSISSLSMVNTKLLQMSLKGLTSSNQSEQFILEDFTKYDRRGIYKSVAIVDTDTNTDTEEEKKSSNNSDTD